jgi:hypothetical protein
MSGMGDGCALVTQTTGEDVAMSGVDDLRSSAVVAFEHLAGITDVLTDVERRADELNRRAAELVEGWL